MKQVRHIRIALSLFVLIAMSSPASASMALFTYDFPGSPGSGLASNQTNPQPAGATFGNFTVTGATQWHGNNVFDSYGWSLSNTADPSIFASFSITAAAGHVLNLSQLTFDNFRDINGPAMLDVALFLNGSGTAYATQTFVTSTSSTNLQFNFTPLTNSDNVTSATFRFYGYQAGNSNQTMTFDNVVTYGSIGVVPEPSTGFVVLFIVVVLVIETRRAGRC